jgi:hypothetical protein
MVLGWEVLEMMSDRERAKVVPAEGSYRCSDGLDMTCLFRCVIMVHQQEAAHVRS